MNHPVQFGNPLSVEGFVSKRSPFSVEETLEHLKVTVLQSEHEPPCGD